MPIDTIKYTVEFQLSNSPSLCISQTFNTKDHSQIVDCSLFCHYIPVELRKIIQSYFGEDNQAETAYIHIAKCAQSSLIYYNILYTGVVLSTLMPEINLTPLEFTGSLQHCANLKLRKQVNSEEKCIFIIEPKRFYKTFSLFDATFEPRLRPSGAPPMLIPPL